MHLGTSAGGRASLYVALERPALFRNVALLSPALTLPISAMEPYLAGRRRPDRRLRVILSAGSYEGVISSDAHWLESYLRKAGVKVTAVYTHQGHSFGAWRGLVAPISSNLRHGRSGRAPVARGRARHFLSNGPTRRIESSPHVRNAGQAVHDPTDLRRRRLEQVLGRHRRGRHPARPLGQDRDQRSIQGEAVRGRAERSGGAAEAGRGEAGQGLPARGGRASGADPGRGEAEVRPGEGEGRGASGVRTALRQASSRRWGRSCSSSRTSTRRIRSWRRRASSGASAIRSAGTLRATASCPPATSQCSPG